MGNRMRSSAWVLDWTSRNVNLQQIPTSEQERRANPACFSAAMVLIAISPKAGTPLSRPVGLRQESPLELLCEAWLWLRACACWVPERLDRLGMWHAIIQD